jgi:hypothetical protein
MECLQPAVLGVESSFELSLQQRKRTLYRLDGGAGTDENLRWLLGRDYQLLTKGFSGCQFSPGKGPPVFGQDGPLEAMTLVKFQTENHLTKGIPQAVDSVSSSFRG